MEISRLLGISRLQDIVAKDVKKYEKENVGTRDDSPEQGLASTKVRTMK